MTTTLTLMQSQETRDTLIKLKARLYDLVSAESDVRKLVYDLYIRKGWQSIGYPSFKACVIAELGTSWQHAYKMVEAEEVSRNVNGSTCDPLPLSHTKHLAALPAEAQPGAYESAKQMARTEGDDTSVQERHVQKAVEVEQLRAHVLLKDRIVGLAMNEGKIAPDAAWAMITVLDKLDGKTRGLVTEFIALYDVRNAGLIMHLVSDLRRYGTANPSRTLQRIIATRCINNRPIAEASPADYAAEKAFTKAEIIAEQLEAERRKRGWIETIITIRRGDPAYTARVLAQELSPFDLLAVMAELQGMINKSAE